MLIPKMILRNGAQENKKNPFKSSIQNADSCLIHFRMADDEDDIWDNSGDDLEIMKMDRSRIENQIETLGFVDGLEQAKTDQNYQDGFNFGFIESAKVSKKCGWLKGRLTAILIHCQIRYDSIGDLTGQ